MKLISKYCPNCGANLMASADAKKVTCDYCKQEILVENRNNLSKEEIQLGNNILKFMIVVFIVSAILSSLIFIIPLLLF